MNGRRNFLKFFRDTQLFVFFSRVKTRMIHGLELGHVLLINKYTFSLLIPTEKKRKVVRDEHHTGQIVSVSILMIFYENNPKDAPKRVANYI